MGLDERDGLTDHGPPSAPCDEEYFEDVIVHAEGSLLFSPSWPRPADEDDDEAVPGEPCFGEEGNGNSSQDEYLRCFRGLDGESRELEADLPGEEEDPEDVERDPERDLEPPSSPDLGAVHEADLLDRARVREWRQKQVVALRDIVEARMPGWWERHSSSVAFLQALCLCNLDDDVSVRELLRDVAESYRCEGGAPVDCGLDEAVALPASRPS